MTPRRAAAKPAGHFAVPGVLEQDDHRVGGRIDDGLRDPEADFKRSPFLADDTDASLLTGLVSMARFWPMRLWNGDRFVPW
jgi:hypothetical protein